MFCGWKEKKAEESESLRLFRYILFLGVLLQNEQ